MKGKYNILFFTTSQPVPTVGGVEQATVTTAKLLRSYGHRVFSMYFSRRSKELNVFEDECILKKHNLPIQIESYIIEKRIHVIIIQTAFEMVRIFRKAIVNHPCKIITAYHFEPIWDKHFVRFRPSYEDFIGKKSVINLIRLLGYPIRKIIHLHKCRRDFRQGFQMSDKVVLLSRNHRSAFLQYVGSHNEDKIVIIPNAIPVDMPDYSYEPTEKDRILLIVSRLDESTKRISLALDIWNNICSQERISNGWSLVIVGGNVESKTKYENYVKQYSLTNVFLVGRQLPWDYYRRASVFLMTSRSEGWGITLLEAQKYGVVPVCFNTFTAAQEVICDNISGYIVNEGDIQRYTDVVLSLMKDSQLRERMARAGIKHVKLFSGNAVGEKWNQLVCQIMSCEKITF